MSDNTGIEEVHEEAAAEESRFERRKRKPAKLRFDDLVGERDTFETVDGKEIEFAHPREFDAVDAARLEHLQKALETNIDRLGENPEDEEAAAEVDRITDEALHVLLPDIDEKTTSRLKTGGKLQIIEWWVRRTGFFAEGIPGEARARALGS